MNAGVATNAGGSSREYRSTMTTSNGCCVARSPTTDAASPTTSSMSAPTGSGRRAEHQLEQFAIELDDDLTRAGPRRRDVARERQCTPAEVQGVQG